MSTIKATITTAAMATMETVDTATITRRSFPAACLRNLSRERYASCPSEPLAEAGEHHKIVLAAEVGPSCSRPETGRKQSVRVDLLALEGLLRRLNHYRESRRCARGLAANPSCAPRSLSLDTKAQLAGTDEPA